MKPVSNTPDIDRQNRIKHLLSDALELDPVSRDDFVRSATIDDASIADEVRVLIGAHERSGHFIFDPTIDGLDSCGKTIGPYTLIRRLGEGGFGSVYMAQQREPIERQVALKIIKPGMDTRQVIARFEAERQVLAMMKHPGIAAVFDAGATAAARPYFVMEFVEGVPITTYCDQHRLPIEERLELFMQVCNAVQHAHTKGVIHRDLKPSNILVTVNDGDGAPLPKVIDFGIAKATSGGPNDATMSADDCRFIGTPQYMSPEQADENVTDIDTRADVYSLGVVLYELLTGVSPFDEQQSRSRGPGAGAGIAEWQRIIREEEPLKPSTKLTTLDTLNDVAAHRATEPNKLVARMRGDLDWITLKAMAKDRERRYSSAADLMLDIQRHLSHEPALASPPSRAYQMKKFVRRHRLGVLASCIIALALIGGAVGLFAGMMQAHESAQRANESAQQATAVNDFMQEILTSVSPDVDGADVRLVEVMDDASAAASEQFAGHPLLEAQIRDLLGEVFNDLSMWNKSKIEFRRAMELWRNHAGADDPRAIRSEMHYVGNALNNRQISEVAARLPDLAARAERIFGPKHLTTLNVQRSIGIVQFYQGNRDEAQRIFLDIREWLLSHGDDDEMQIRILSNLILIERAKAMDSINESSQVILSQVEQFAREQAERAARTYGDDALIALDAQVNLARALSDRRQFEAAERLCRTLLDANSTGLGECHDIRLEAIDVLSHVLHRLGDSAAAAELCIENVECARRTGSAMSLIVTIADALPILDRGKRWVEGEALAREYTMQLQAIGGGHGDMLFEAEQWTPRFLSLQGQLDEAEDMFQEMLTRESIVDLSGRTRARLHLFHGSNLCRLGLHEAAEKELQKAAHSLVDYRLGTHHANPDDVLVEFIALYQAWGRPEKAAEYQAIRQQTLANLSIDPN